MKTKKVPLHLMLLISITTLSTYGAVEGNKTPDTRTTKSYQEKLASAEEYYDKALRGEVSGEKTIQKAFLLSSLKIGRASCRERV